MRSLELILLVFAYTILVLTIFVGFLCYKRNLEKWETLALAISLLVLIVSLTVSPLLERTKAIETTNVFTLLAMVLVGMATPLNVLSERKHKIPKYSKNVLYVIVLILLPLIVVGHFFDFLKYLEYPVIFFLGISVVLSMVLIRVTKPKRIIAHREKVEQIFAIAFLILVPISLFANYALTESGYSLSIGFTLPLIFILLSANKLLDDLERLALFKSKIEPIEQHFKNYSLTDREKEIATHLLKGKTYKNISEELFISLPTVKTHTSNIYRKCGVKNRYELTVLIIK